jgi:hypothetical protein
MRSKYRSVCLGVLILATAAARADDLEAQKRGQTLPAAPVSRSDAPRVDLEAQKLGQSPSAAPASPLDTPSTDLEAMKRTLPPPTSPSSPADAPSVDLEELKQLGQRPATKAASWSLEVETQRISQVAIDAIPLKRGSGPRILPFPDVDGRPIPIGQSR